MPATHITPFLRRAAAHPARSPRHLPSGGAGKRVQAGRRRGGERLAGAPARLSASRAARHGNTLRPFRPPCEGVSPCHMS